MLPCTIRHRKTNQTLSSHFAVNQVQVPRSTVAEKDHIRCGRRRRGANFNKLRVRRVRPTRYSSARVQEPNFVGLYSCRDIRNLLTNFDVSGTFRSRLMGQHLSDAPLDIATLTVDLAGRW